MAYDIDSLKANLDPARAYRWELVVPSPPSGVAGDILSVRCQSTSKLGRSFGSINIPFKQTAGLKVAGRAKYSQAWSMTFVEGEDGKVASSINAWMNLIVNDKTGLGMGDNLVKRNMYLRLLDSNEQVTQKFKVIGCYPESISDVALAYSSDNAMQYSVTFAFDKWEED